MKCSYFFGYRSISPASAEAVSRRVKVRLDTFGLRLYCCLRVLFSSGWRSAMRIVQIPIKGPERLTRG